MENQDFSSQLRNIENKLEELEKLNSNIFKFLSSYAEKSKEFFQEVAFLENQQPDSAPVKEELLKLQETEEQKAPPATVSMEPQAATTSAQAPQQEAAPEVKEPPVSPAAEQSQPNEPSLEAPKEPPTPVPAAPAAEVHATPKENVIQEENPIRETDHVEEAERETGATEQPDEATTKNEEPGTAGSQTLNQ